MSSVADELFASRDLLAVGAALAAAVVATAVGTTSAVRLPFTALLLLVLPGYVTAALAYAERERGALTFPALVERFALSLGCSLAILPLLAILLSVGTGSLTRWGLVGAASGYVVLGAAATVVRRARRSGSASGRGRASGPGGGSSASPAWPSGGVTPVRVLLGVSVLLAVATLGAAVTVPADGEATTDLHLLTERDGAVVANEYPDALTEGETASVVVGVTNDEHRAVAYTAVTELQRVEVDGRSIVVADKRTVDRRGFELAHGETRRESQSFRATLVGENVRLVTYLYRGDPPANPTAESAYRTVYVWVDVSPAGAAGE